MNRKIKKINVECVYYKNGKNLVGSAHFSYLGSNKFKNIDHALTTCFLYIGEVLVPPKREIFKGAYWTCNPKFPGLRNSSDSLCSLESVHPEFQSELIFPPIKKRVLMGLNGSEEILKDYSILNHHHPFIGNVSRKLFISSEVYETSVNSSSRDFGITRGNSGIRRKPCSFNSKV